MGTRTSSLSAGADQQQLDAHLDTQPGDHQDQVWFCHLWSLSSPVGSRTKAKRRSLSVRRQEAHFAFDAARQREQTEAVKKEYAKRAGVEGVHAQGERTMGLLRSRYMGEPRTHLQHVVTATAMKVCRWHDWLEGISPHATPLSHFARFMKEAA